MQHDYGQTFGDSLPEMIMLAMYHLGRAPELFTNPLLVKLLAIVACAAVAYGVVLSLLLYKYRAHQARWRVAAASKLIARLQRTKGVANQITVLRRCNCFVFEEAILTAFERAGATITRNMRYTGDGGVDGRFRYKGRTYIVQAKRYKGHIKLAHVKEFVQLAKRRSRRGVFVHSGVTGKESRAVLLRCKEVSLISGKNLLRLLLGDASVMRLLAPECKIVDIATARQSRSREAA